MIYIASPYSSPNPTTVEARYQRVCEFVDRMIEMGFVAFSPIVYIHPIAQRIRFGTDAQKWLHFNMSMLRRAEAMYVLQLEGWRQSEGLKIELNVCSMLDIPVAHYNNKFELITEAWRGHLVEKF